ncbi:MAG: metallophosphoesterase [Pseudomonadota bacterium]
MTHHILHISDCHLVGPGDRLIGVDTQETLQQVLAAALAQREPAGIIASGDLAHLAEAAVYERFVQTVRDYSAAPLMCLPGNHDVLDQMRAAQLPFTPLRIADWAIVWLDSHIDDEPEAHVGPADLEHVQVQMRGSDARWLIVATHHPLVGVGAPWLDKDRIQKPAELIQWLAESSVRDDEPRLQACVFGHAHQEVTARVAARDGEMPLWGVPSTCFQFKPRSERFSLDTAGPGFAWLHLHDDGRITRTVERIDYTFEFQLARGG